MRFARLLADYADLALMQAQELPLHGKVTTRGRAAVIAKGVAVHELDLTWSHVLWVELPRDCCMN